MNMKQILNDPELLAQLDMAYALAEPYREKVQYRLSIINQANVIRDTLIYHPIHGMLIAIHSKAKITFVNPLLKE